MGEPVTLEWFGATTFRLVANGITMFLDTWLDRPEFLPIYLKISDVEECDYIFISHAHFDHLPGADRLAKKTGATIIGNGEAINVMRAAGVPETQLMAVAGGERIPLFTKSQREKAITNPRPGPPGAPAMPNPEDATITVHAWPSLHAMLPPGDHTTYPEFIDSGTVYTGEVSHQCTLDVTRGLTYGLGGLMMMPQFPPQMSEDMKSFLTYLKTRDINRHSFYDGGQIAYNFILGDKTVFWNGHLGAYEGIIKTLEPKPDAAILAIAGRANLNGRPFDGSAADFAVREVKWLGEPSKVIWCLHDEGALNPKYIKTEAATELVSTETKSTVVTLKHAERFELFGS